MPRRTNPTRNERHIVILKAIKELQPCSSGAISNQLDMDIDKVTNAVFETLYKLGLVDTDLVTWNDEGVMRSKRVPGTIRLTKDGEELLKSLEG